jgi:hypothetical protein
MWSKSEPTKIQIVMRSILKQFIRVLLAVCMAGFTHAMASNSPATVSETQQQTAAEKLWQKADSCLQDIEKMQKLVDLVNPTVVKDLPVGIVQKFGNSSVTIALSSRVIHVNYSSFSVFCKIILPQGKTLYFGATEVKVANDGSIIGDAKLYLLKDVSIPFGSNSFTVMLKGAKNLKVPDPQSETYATFSCSGIKEISLSADILFPAQHVGAAEAEFGGG